MEDPRVTEGDTGALDGARGSVSEDHQGGCILPGEEEGDHPAAEVHPAAEGHPAAEEDEPSRKRTLKSEGLF